MGKRELIERATAAKKAAMIAAQRAYEEWQRAEVAADKADGDLASAKALPDDVPEYPAQKGEKP